MLSRSALGRRWPSVVVVLALLGSGLAVLALPAAAQVSPSVSISPTSAPAASSGTWSIVVSGQNWRAARSISIQFANDAQTFITPPGTSFSTTITPARRIAGNYIVRVIQNCSDFDTCPVERTATFTSTVTLSLDPACSTPGSPQSLVVRGAGWNPQFPVNVYYDYPATGNAQSFVPAGNGDFARTFSVTPPNRDVVVFAEQPRLQFSARAVWSPCPPGPTTTTTSTSTTQPPSTTVTTAPPDDTVPDSTTSTTRPPVDIPGTPVTIPPTVDLPPPTAGATLTVTPELGPAGFVTRAVGTGFPPGAVTLAWSPGIGTVTAIVGPDGTFTASMLIFPNDRLGPRALIAIGGGTTAFDAFLVVQSSVQPSGQDVQQINRIRRFNSR